MSSCASIVDRMKLACASILPARRSSPCGLAAGVPCRRTSRRQRITLAALTPNRAVAVRQDIPPSIATTTRSRRSCDSTRGIHADLLTRHQPESENRARVPPQRSRKRGKRFNGSALRQTRRAGPKTTCRSRPCCQRGANDRARGIPGITGSLAECEEPLGIMRVQTVGPTRLD